VRTKSVSFAAPALLLLACTGPSATGSTPTATSTPSPQAVIAAPVLTPRAPPPAAAPAPTAPAAAYDLAADRRLRIDEGKKELGARAATTIVSDTFVFVSSPGPGSESFTPSVSLATSALNAYYNNRFRTPPHEAISVYLFWTAASYEAYCKRTWNEPCLSKYGFFRPQERRIVMNAGLGLGTLTHELVHPIVASDFPDAPTWLNEGIASLFEGPVLPRPGEIHGAKNWRLPRLRSALTTTTEKAHARPSGLFGLSHEAFRGDLEDLNYATARYFCQWLDQKNLLWPFYQAWRDDFANDPNGDRAFLKVTGQTPEQADPKFVTWLATL
jgi:hypothetical protein